VALKSTIQCKFIGKPGATLTLAGLKDELPKAAKLAQQGLARDYVILTNAGVSGDADQQICAAFEAAGVTKCRVFGGSWMIQQLAESPVSGCLYPGSMGSVTCLISSPATATIRPRQFSTAWGQTLAVLCRPTRIGKLYRRCMITAL
jgi:hypothetical protein